MSYRAILTHVNNQIMFAYLEDDRAIELGLYQDASLQVGTIFLARVAKVCPNIDACFVEIAKGKNAFLQSNAYHEGDLVCVRMVRAGTKNKEPLVTDEISIGGTYSVVYPGHEIKVSHKLDAQIRKNLIKTYKPLCKENGCSVIIRTNAATASESEVWDEVSKNAEKLNHIIQYSSMRTKGILYEPEKEWLLAVLNLYRTKLDEIITDDDEIYEEMCKHAGELETVQLIKYQDPLLSLSARFSLKAKLKDATSKRVWLKCGGFLVIEPTEALVSIDVNSGKTTRKADKEETFLRVNLEAAEEIARQVRLRNLSGIILIDFINMESASNQAKLLSELRSALKDDPIKTQVHGMTSLGLVEMTRMKGRSTLYEQAGLVSNDAAVSGDEG